MILNSWLSAGKIWIRRFKHYQKNITQNGYLKVTSFSYIYFWPRFCTKMIFPSCDLNLFLKRHQCCIWWSQTFLYALDDIIVFDLGKFCNLNQLYSGWFYKYLARKITDFSDEKYNWNELYPWLFKCTSHTNLLL